MNKLQQAVTVRHCFLPNSKVQTFEPETCLRGEFQIKHLAKIAARDDFAYFIILQDVGREVIMTPEFRCQCLVTWVDKSGTYHSQVVGVNRMLSKEVICPGKPAELTHVVYTSRCK